MAGFLSAFGLGPTTPEAKYTSLSDAIETAIGEAKKVEEDLPAVVKLLQEAMNDTEAKAMEATNVTKATAMEATNATKLESPVMAGGRRRRTHRSKSRHRRRRAHRSRRR